MGQIFAFSMHQFEKCKFLPAVTNISYDSQWSFSDKIIIRNIHLDKLSCKEIFKDLNIHNKEHPIKYSKYSPRPAKQES